MRRFAGWIAVALVVSGLPFGWSADVAPALKAKVMNPGEEEPIPPSFPEEKLDDLAFDVPEPPALVQPNPAAEPLTLERLVALAAESNPTLVQAHWAIHAAQGQEEQAGLYPNPTLGYKIEEWGGVIGYTFEGGTFTQTLVTNNKLGLARAVASQDVEQAKWAYESQRMRVENDIRISFYQLLLAQRRIEYSEHLLGIQETIAASSEKRQVAGEATAVEVAQAKIEVEQARLNLYQSRAQYSGVWRRMVAMVGRPDLEPARADGDATRQLPTINWDDALQKVLSQSPELAKAQAGVERARANLAQQKAMQISNVDVATGVKYDKWTGYTVADVEVGMPIQFFNRNQGNISKAYADWVAAQHEVKRVELDLRNRLAVAFEEYTNARFRAEANAKTILPAARQSLELARAGYRQGEYTYLMLLTAQTTYVSTVLKYLDNLQSLWEKGVEVEGMLLRGALTSPQSP